MHIKWDKNFSTGVQGWNEEMKTDTVKNETSSIIQGRIRQAGV